MAARLILAGTLVAAGALADGISESATSGLTAPGEPAATHVADRNEGARAAANGTAPGEPGSGAPKNDVDVRGGRVAEARADLSVSGSAAGMKRQRRSTHLTRRAQVSPPTVSFGPDGKIRLRLNTKIKLKASRLDVRINARNLRADADLTLDLDAPTVSAQP